MQFRRTAYLSLLFFLLIPAHLAAQLIIPLTSIRLVFGTLYPSVPLLTTGPDAVTVSQGGAAVAGRADMNSQHWNLAKYPFAETPCGISVSLQPLVRDLLPDYYFGYFAGYCRIDSLQTISSSVRYFSGSTIYYNGITELHPWDMAFDAGYSRLFTDSFSGGIALRFIYSDIAGVKDLPDYQGFRAGTSVAADLGLYYRNRFYIGNKKALRAAGMHISNIGTPLAYSDDDEETPLPANLRIGNRFKYNVYINHSVSISADLNKLLVPTPPVYGTDTITGEQYVLYGKEIPESVLAGIFQSFYNAPGIMVDHGKRSVFMEELYEITIGIGAEYLYMDRFAFRTGYFRQHSTKGNLKYLSLGAGIRFRIVTVDASWWITANGYNPHNNNVVLTLSVGINNPGNTRNAG